MAVAVNKSLIDYQKPAIGEEKSAIDDKKSAVDRIKSAIEQQKYNEPSKANILNVYDEIEKNQIFGTKEIKEILDCSPSTARAVMTKLRDMINIYKYAKGENADYELVVGNSMRRVMEAYGSFMYKKGIEQLSTASEIKQKLEPPFGDHFENLMYRLVLHGGSHNEERVKSMVSDDFLTIFLAKKK